MMAFVLAPVSSQAQSSRELKRLEASLQAAEATCDADGFSQLLSDARTNFPASQTVWYRSALQAIEAEKWPDANYYTSVARALAPFSKEALASTGIAAAAQGDKTSALVNLDNLTAVCSGNCSREVELLAGAIKLGKLQSSKSRLKASTLPKDKVSEMQTALTARGYNAGIADGIYGNGTRAALIKYLQAEHGEGHLTCQALDQLLAPIQIAAPDSSVVDTAVTTEPTFADRVGEMFGPFRPAESN